MPSKKMSNNTTMCYNYGGGDKEFVFSCKNRPFAVLCSKHLPTPATTLIDHNLIMELGLKLTDLQCKKISFAGRKLRLLGKISTTVQCIKEGKMFANINLRASVVENLKDVIDSHCIAGQKMAQMLSNDVLRLDDTNSDNDDDHDAVSKGPNLKQDPPYTPSVSSSMSTASPSVSGTPSNTGFSPIVLSDAAVAMTTPPSRAQLLVLDDGFSPLTANLTAIDEMFGGADIMSDVEEEEDILAKHNHTAGGGQDANHVYKSRHGRYKCNRVQCDVLDDPWRQIPHNCGFHPDFSLPSEFQFCGEDCRGAFCRCLKFYQT